MGWGLTIVTPENMLKNIKIGFFMAISAECCIFAPDFGRENQTGGCWVHGSVGKNKVCVLRYDLR